MPVRNGDRVEAWVPGQATRDSYDMITKPLLVIQPPLVRVTMLLLRYIASPYIYLIRDRSKS